MNPAWSFTTTGSLPHASTNPTTASIVSSLAHSGRTISTSDIAGAGLKKCTPQTRSGRDVSIARSMTESVEVFVARIARVVHGAVEFVEQGLLHREVLDDRLDHEVAVVQVGQARRRRHARSKGVGLLLGALLSSRPACASDFSSPASIASAVAWERLRTITVAPAAAADLGDAAAHDARTKHANFLKGHPANITGR